MRALIPGWGPAHMTPSNPDHLPKLPPSTSTLGVKASTYEFWGDTVQSTANTQSHLEGLCPSLPRGKSHRHNSTPGPVCPHPGAEGARGGLSGAASGGACGPTERPLGFSCSLLGQQEASHLLWGVLAEPPVLPWGSLFLRSHQTGGSRVSFPTGARQAGAADTVSPTGGQSEWPHTTSPQTCSGVTSSQPWHPA